MHASTLIAAGSGFTLNDIVDGLERLTPYLADSAAKGVFILLAAIAAVVLLRRRSAAARHLVWTLALVGLLLVPVLSAVLPEWYVMPSFDLGPVAQSEPHDASAETSSADVPETQHGDSDLVVAATAPAVAERRPIRPQRADRDSHESPYNAAQPVARTTTNAPSANNGGSTHSNAANKSDISDVALASETHPLAGLARWAVAVWLVGAVGLFARLILSWAALVRIERRAEFVSDASLLSLLDQSRERIGVRRRVTPLADARHAMPLTWGTLRPRLLLPAAAVDWPRERQQMVLLHELAHIKRWDYAAQLVAQFAAALYWFNPLVWWAKRRMTVEREVACDDVVLAAGERPSSYAEHLLSIAKCAGDPRNGNAAAAIAMARPTLINGRIRAILDRRRSHAVLARRIVLASLLALSAVAVPLAMLRAAGESQRTQKDDPSQTADQGAEVDSNLAGASAEERIVYFPEECAVGVVYTRELRPERYEWLYEG